MGEKPDIFQREHKSVFQNEHSTVERRDGLPAIRDSWVHLRRAAVMRRSIRTIDSNREFYAGTRFGHLGFPDRGQVLYVFFVRLIRLADRDLILVIRLDVIEIRCLLDRLSVVVVLSRFCVAVGL